MRSLNRRENRYNNDESVDFSNTEFGKIVYNREFSFDQLEVKPMYRKKVNIEPEVGSGKYDLSDLEIVEEGDSVEELTTDIEVSLYYLQKSKK